MQNQNKKMFRWILGGGLLTFLLLVPETLIAKLISNNNYEVYTSYAMTMILITFFIYIIISIIKIVQYQKYAKNYKQKAIKELSTEFKPILLNYSDPIPKDLFQCEAKIGNDGKIICKIQLDYEVKIENSEKFLSFFHFDQE